MSEIAATLKLCHEIVWKYRQQLEDYWPTPTTEDALLFSFTELGEAVDAHLRSKPQYARNNAKDLSVLDELADCALMLITALGKKKTGWLFRKNFWGIDDHSWNAYCADAGTVLLPTIGNMPIVDMLARIATHPGMDLPARLTERLERIWWKRYECNWDVAPIELKQRWWYLNYKHGQGGEKSFEEWKTQIFEPMAQVQP